MKHIINFNNYNSKINETRQQLEFPFDGKDPLHDKPIHVHLIDALTKLDNDNGVDKKTYTSNLRSNNISDMWLKHEDEAFQIFSDSIEGGEDESTYYEITIYYMNLYSPLEYPDIYNDELNDFIESNDIIDENDIIEEFDLEYTNIKEYLSESEFVHYNEIVNSIFEERQTEYNCLGTITDEITDNGLIPIYRANTYNTTKEKDAYLNILDYGSTGIYWSFDMDGAIAHCGGGGETYVLCAYIKPEYINWVNTIYKSVYALRDEKEIEVYENKDILIHSIIEKKTDKMVKLKKDYIIKT